MINNPAIPQPENGKDFSEEEYYAIIEDAMNHYDGWPPLDLVASQLEYARFRRALMRWVAKQDADYDGWARDQEHGIE